MSDGTLTQGYLFPLNDVDQHEIRNTWALDGTGLNGLFVSYQTGIYTGLAGTFNQNPDNADGYPNPAVSPGASYTNIFTSRYLNNRRVKPSAFGDFPWQVAGITLNTVAEYDENGQKLVLMPEYLRKERGFILTGQTVPVAKRGFFTLRASQVANIATVSPTAGVPFIVSGLGQPFALNAVQASGAFLPYIIGRFTSATGTNNGGYVELEVQC